MTGEQQELYQAHVQRLQMLLSKQSPEEFDRSRIQILSELTRLRQLCCDPALLYEKYTSGAAKLDLCLDLIRNAMESGHKMLVFFPIYHYAGPHCRKTAKGTHSLFHADRSHHKAGADPSGNRIQPR